MVTPMNHQDRQEQSEQFYVEHFLHCIGRPFRRVCAVNDVAPDVFVELANGGLLAIEVTEHHSSAVDTKGRPRRAIESDWRILRQLISDEKSAAWLTQCQYDAVWLYLHWRPMAFQWNATHGWQQVCGDKPFERHC
jgi:hypothetical protein